MGEIIGAAIVSHHPGLMQSEEFRVREGAGADSDLVEGYRRVRARIDALKPDVLVIFDSHWFTTGYHLVEARAHLEGVYTSVEMPWYLHGLPYNYAGAPDLADLCQQVAEERGVMARAVRDPHMGREYATLNLVHYLRKAEKVLTVGNCQNCQSKHFLEMGAVVGEAIKRSPYRCVLLASGALSHKFNEIDWQRKNPRIYHPDNVARPEFVQSDAEARRLFAEGRHDEILVRFDPEYRKIPWEGLGGHYLQMVGAMGGSSCRAKGVELSAYENARGTGNIHLWFDVQRESVAT